MHVRLLARCAVATVGALTFFTMALATPAQCRFGVHRPIAEMACNSPSLREGRQAFQQSGDRASLISVSIVAGRKSMEPGTLEEGRSGSGGNACLSTQDRRCWTNALINACIVHTGAK